jgi:AraC family transcriptional regulator
MRPPAIIPKLPPGNFYGETVRQHRAGGFSLSETLYPRGSALPRHSHASHYFCFVLSGSYKESYDRKTRSCEPLTILYHPAGEIHAQSFEASAVELFRIEVNPARLRYPGQTSLSMDGRDFRGGYPIVLAHRLYHEFREPDSVSYLAIEGLGLELIATLARSSQRRTNNSREPQRWLSRAHDLIKSRYLEHLSVNGIAGAVGVHPVTLAREFRRQYGCTVGQMVRCERIDFACRELVKRNASVAAIAISAGFYDQSHFARTFKKLIGLTPVDYRDNFRPR